MGSSKSVQMKLYYALLLTPSLPDEITQYVSTNGYTGSEELRKEYENEGICALILRS